MRAPDARKLAESRLNLREANLLTAHLLKIEPPELALHMDEQIDEDILLDLIEQRLAGMPLQYLLGSTGFMSLNFAVGPGVLIPRPDTEIIVERAIALLKQYQAVLGHNQAVLNHNQAVLGHNQAMLGHNQAVLGHNQAMLDHSQAMLVGDICTGSGAIAISLAHFLPQAQIYATDSSPKALAYAQANAIANKVDNRCRLLPGDLGAPLAMLGLTFDLLVSNPPYISREEMAQLPVDVRQEPEMALFGGDDGLDFYRRLAVETVPLLKPGGYLLLEHGYLQQEKLAALMKEAGWQVTEKLRDYGNRPRGLLLTREK